MDEKNLTTDEGTNPEGNGEKNTSGQGENSQNNGKQTGTNNQSTEPKAQPISFDDFLKQKGNQAEFDRRINAAVQKGISNAKEKWEAITNDKVSEAEKLALMSQSEKTDYLQKKKEKELAEREAEINKHELEATAKNTLADKGLPKELAGILNYTDAESCKKSIDQVEKAFRRAVQDAVSDRLKGGEPMKKAGQPTEKDMEAEVAKALAGHI